MKKILLGISLFVIASFSILNAQDNIEIRLDGVGADISGTTHTVNLDPSSPELVGGIYDVHFIVTNLTGSDQQWRISRKKISVPSSWVDQVCWPPLCYNASGDLYVTPNTGGNPAPIIVDGEDTTTTGLEAELKPRITPDQAAAGSALYRYYITAAAGGAYMDSIDLSVNFTLGLTTIKQTPVLNISPNPADEYVNISVGSAENASIRIVDVLGNVVYNETISNGTKNIDVSNFKNGVYFVLVETPGVKSINRKLIIRH